MQVFPLTFQTDDVTKNRVSSGMNPEDASGNNLCKIFCIEAVQGRVKKIYFIIKSKTVFYYYKKLRRVHLSLHFQVRFILLILLGFCDL